MIQTYFDFSIEFFYKVISHLTEALALPGCFFPIETSPKSTVIEQNKRLLEHLFYHKLWNKQEWLYILDNNHWLSI